MFEVVAVFHGGTDVIETPDVRKGRPYLDFGPGFYVTDIYVQAKEWAIKIGERRAKSAVVNTYHLRKAAMVAERRGLRFEAYDMAWLEFITQSRLGSEPWSGLDYVEGGVADDNVIDTVRLYMNGYIPAEVAISELKYFKPTNQICILSQEVIREYLTFVKSEVI